MNPFRRLWQRFHPEPAAPKPGPRPGVYITAEVSPGPARAHLGLHQGMTLPRGASAEIPLPPEVAMLAAGGAKIETAAYEPIPLPEGRFEQTIVIFVDGAPYGRLKIEWQENPPA